MDNSKISVKLPHETNYQSATDMAWNWSQAVDCMINEVIIKELEKRKMAEVKTTKIDWSNLEGLKPGNIFFIAGTPKRYTYYINRSRNLFHNSEVCCVDKRTCIFCAPFAPSPPTRIENSKIESTQATEPQYSQDWFARYNGFIK